MRANFRKLNVSEGKGVTQLGEGGGWRATRAPKVELNKNICCLLLHLSSRRSIQHLGVLD